MKRGVAATVAAAALAATPTANAHELTVSQKRVFKHRWQLSAYKVAWYTGRGRWTTWPRYRWCRDLRFARARGRCYVHRANLRWHERRVARIGRLLWPPRPAAPSSSGPSWLVNAFMCIHRYEGDWTANTGNGYEGGLQFGRSEWQTYGGQYAAHAYEASPSQQIAAAIAYHQVSGFRPWPNTARACGLL